MKVIGVCLARVTEEINRKYIEEIKRYAEKKDCKVVVFHTVYSFIFAEDFKNQLGSKYVYDILPYKKLDALILMDNTIFYSDVVDEIVENANKEGIPIINVRGIRENCYNICSDYKDIYRKLIEKVIKDNNVTKPYFLSGRKENDYDSNIRMECYKKAIENCGIEFDEKNVGYGEFWEIPTEAVVDSLFMRDEPFPEAIIAANDVMALTVINKITAKGIRVPEDCVVTGFDGFESARYSSVGLTSCFENVSDSVSHIFEIIEKVEKNEQVPYITNYSYVPVYSRSTGHKRVKDPGLSRYTYKTNRSIEVDEFRNNTWMDIVFELPNLSNFKDKLGEIIYKDRAIVIREDGFIEEDRTKDSKSLVTLPENLLIISKSKEKELLEEKITYDEIFDRFIDMTEVGSVGFISSLYVKNIVYGLEYESHTDAFADGDCVNRFGITLNRALFACYSGEKQTRLTEQIRDSKYKDAVTGVMNMDGLNKWFNENTSEKSVHNKRVSVGVYSFISYQQIYDRFGIDLVEDILSYIAHSLQLANPSCKGIARISVDTFAMVKVYEDEEEYSKNIDKSIQLFYGFLDVKKKTFDGEYVIEVSCGYHDVNPPWDNKLDYYINAALSALYLNRVNYQNKNIVGVDKNNPRDFLKFQKKFLALIDKNLFVYHFQPIVDAHNGKIVAYEALMRTTKEIGLNPLEVLDAALLFNKLRNIETATFRNVFNRIHENPHQFEGKKIFINSIPGHFLNEDEVAEFREMFGEHLAKAVIEITETETITTKELTAIKSFGTADGTMIAIDDYGTGHSNIVNLLEYKPQVVKIDRYLITNIQEDINKQMFVKNLIEFAGKNNIKVLAEGVETKEEMKTVIEFGVDYIQGYYTAKPAFEPLDKLPDEILNEIISYNK